MGLWIWTINMSNKYIGAVIIAAINIALYLTVIHQALIH